MIGPILLVVALSGAALASRVPLPGSVVVTRAGFFVFAAFAVAGFALTLRATPRLGFRTLLVTAVLAQLVVAPALPFTSRDAFANLVYGRMLERGGDPYLVTPRAFFGHDAASTPAELTRSDPFLHDADPRWLDTRCVYGPVVAAIDWLAVLLGRTPAGALLIAKLCALAAALVGITLCARHTRRHPDARERFVLVALNPLYAWELSGQAHNDVFLIPPLLAFVFALHRGRLPAAALWAGVSMLVKPVVLPALLLALVVPVRGKPRAFATPALMLAIVAAVLVAGWAPLWSGPATLGVVARSLVGGHVGASNSLAEALRDLAIAGFDVHAGDVAVHVCRGLGLAAAALVGLGALRRVRAPADVIDEGLLVNLFLFTVVAWFQPWYVTWLLPFVLVTRERPLARLAAGYGAALLPAYLTGLYVTSWVAHLVVLFRLFRAGRPFAPPAKPPQVSSS